MECLLEQEVDTVFGYPGGTILNLYDELYNYQDRIHHILTAHEQGAAHAADGYARSTGKVGVCFATSGPGATNLVTGIATAYMDSSPIVFITCNVTEQTLGKDAFQEVDITGIAMPITKATYLVRDAQTIPDVMRQAFAVAATGRPGPVLIDFLKNVTFPSVEIDYEFVPWSRNRSCSSIQSLATSHELKAPEPNKGDIDTLVEMVRLGADMKELKANPGRPAKGTVIEARLDTGRGPVATILVQNGTLRTGDTVIAGTAMGRVRVMTDDQGRKVDEAGPSMPVEITGLGEVPSAGDVFNAVADEKLARELVEKRKYEEKEEVFKSYHKVTLDNLFSQIAEGEVKELPVIVKADVQGSVEAVRQSLEKLSSDEVRVRVIHGAVGGVSKSDVMLAQASGAIIVGFNVRPDSVARDDAEREGVEIRLYRIIYDAIEDVKNAMKGLLAPKIREVDLGRAEVRQVYKISSVGTVSGCYVLEGKIERNAKIRVVRDNIIIADDELASLKRFKDDVKEVAQSYECGITLQKFNDIKEGDVFEAYILEEYRED